VARANGTRAAAAADPVHKAQAAAEGVPLTGTVALRGRQFRLGPCDAVAPTLDFAEAATKGVDTDDPAGLAAMKEMIRDSFVQVPSCGTCEACEAERYDDCPALDLGDFPKFWRFAKAVRVPADELLEVVQQAIEQATARPTPARSGSSSPARSRSANSKGSSSSRELPAAFQELADRGDLIAVDDYVHR
jgi:thiol-disulfide isomerase/thioredoxin